MVVPWLVITVVVLPVLDYIHTVRLPGTSEDSVGSILTHWKLSMLKILEFKVGWMDMSTYWNMTEHFYQRYMWFVALLCLFFVVYALFESAQRRRRLKSPGNALPTMIVFLNVTVINIILFGLVRSLAYPEFMGSGWFSLGNIIQFQAGKLTIYACCFGMGVAAWQGRRFEEGRGFGKPLLWGTVCFCLFGANMFVLKNLNASPTPGLASHSYNMYLAHYAVPFTLPLLMSNWNAPLLAKFLVVSATTILFSYCFSRYFLRPLLKQTVIKSQ